MDYSLALVVQRATLSSISDPIPTADSAYSGIPHFFAFYKYLTCRDYLTLPIQSGTISYGEFFNAGPTLQVYAFRAFIRNGLLDGPAGSRLKVPMCAPPSTLSSGWSIEISGVSGRMVRGTNGWWGYNATIQ